MLRKTLFALAALSAFAPAQVFAQATKIAIGTTPLADVMPAFIAKSKGFFEKRDRKSTRLNSSHIPLSRMPSSA